MRPRSTSTASATARTPSSPASWSTSRKPASIPATAPARCRRIRSTTRQSPSWSGRRARSRSRSTSAGLMNVQYAIKDGEIYVLEVNPRASRTVPFVAKVIGHAGRQDRGARHGRREAFGLQSRAQAAQAPRGEGSGVPLRALPRRRHRARAGDEVDRRSDGHRRFVRDRLRQEPDRRRHAACPAAERSSSR